MTKETFDQQIRRFNELYKLPVRDTPGLPFMGTKEKSAQGQFIDRMIAFKQILMEEVEEVEEIIRKIQTGDHPADVLSSLADWLGDIQIYCASEMRKFGLDNEVILSTIMASNMSKLGEDGKPIYDERGKVMKGPRYWAPETMIRQYIIAAARQAAKAAQSSDKA